MSVCSLARRRHCVFGSDRLRSSAVIQFQGRMKGTGHTQRGEVESPFFRATYSETRVRALVNSARWFATRSAGVVWLASGCFSPDVDGPCRVPCEFGCPEGWGCNNDYCVPPKYDGTCKSSGGSLSVGGSGGAQWTATGGAKASVGGQPDLGLGGAKPGFGGDLGAGVPSFAGATGGEMNTAGVSGTGGGRSTGGVGSTGGLGGDGGAGGSPRPTIDIERTAPASVCSGSVSLEFKATGGKAPYQWRAGNTCGLSLSGDDGTAYLVGNAAAGECVLALSVEDAAGAVGAFRESVTFRDLPTLDPIKLDPACLFEEFEAALTARGGDATSRRFETPTPGWSFIGNKLHTSVSSETERKVSVRVRDDYCVSPALEFELPLERSNKARCFTLNPLPKPLPDAPVNALPRPCAGMPYPLRIEFSPQPASWNVIAFPAGSKLQPDSRSPGALSLQGSANWPAGEKSTFQFELVHTDGRRFRYTYDLVARDKCWFAYVGREQSLWQLRLLDPELGDLGAHPNFGPADGEVTSMAFSPDGRFVVYQATRAAQVGLTLVNLRNLQEQPLSFAGNVEHYVWSPDSSLLAVVTRDTGTTLGGIDVSGVATSSQSESGIQGLTYLQPLVTAVETAPVWFGERAIAIVVSAAPMSYRTRNIRVEGNQFTDAVDVSFTYAPPPTIVGFREGYATSNGTFLNFVNTSEWSTPTLHPHMFNPLTSFSPNGVYAGNTASDGTLRWFAPAALELTAAPEAASEAGQCHALLAWSSDGNRVACVTDLGVSEGALRFFERKSPTSSLLTTSINTNDYAYSEQTSNERRRVFSGNGRSFAFSTSTDLYVVDLTNPRAFYAFKTGVTTTEAERSVEANTIDLAFSTDANFLIEQRAERLTLLALAANSNRYWPLDTTMSTAPGCQEKYMVSPKSWCGAVSSPRDYRWSPRENRLAFVNQAHTLTMTYVALGVDAVSKRVVNPTCSAPCVRNLEFQP